MKKNKIKTGTIDRSGFTVTAGVTADGKYSLAVQKIDGVYCLAIHKCDVRGGLHYSSMDDSSLITYIKPTALHNALQYANEKNHIESLMYLHSPCRDNT